MNEPIELKLDTGRKSIVIDRAGDVSSFEYDIVEMKLLSEEMELKHGLRSESSDKVGTPTIPFLREYAQALTHLGMRDCSVDAAFRFYNLIGTQFVLMTAQLDQQIRAIVKG